MFGEGIGLNGNPEGDPDDPKFNKKKRKFLQFAAGAAVVAGGAAIFGPKKENRKAPITETPAENEPLVAETKVIEEEKIIPPGETIQSPIGKLGTSGLKVYVDGQSLEEFWEKSKKTNRDTGGYDKLRYSMKVYNLDGKNPEDRARRKLVGGFEVSEDDPYADHQPAPDDSPEEAAHWPKPYEPKVIGQAIRFHDKSGQEVLGMYAFPVPEKPVVTVDILLHHMHGEESTTEVYRYHLGERLNLPKAHQQEILEASNPEEKSKVKIRAYSETPLPQEAFSNIHNLHKICSEFNLPVVIAVVEGDPKDTAKERLTRHTPSHGEGDIHGLIRINADAFLRPQSPNEAEHMACLDLVLSVYNQLESKQKVETTEELLKAFKALEEAATRDGMEPKDSAYSNIFSRDNYIKRPAPNELGEEKKIWDFPWFKPEELFASVVTTARYFPKELVGNFKKLKPEQQETIKLIIQQEFHTLLQLNPNKESVKKLIPELDFLSAQLGIEIK